MKKLSVLILVTILGIGLWALPAGAEKVRLTDDQMDSVSAGLTVPGFPVDKEFDFTRHRDFFGGLTGDLLAHTYVQAPCKAGPSLLCMSGGADVYATLGTFGAFVGGTGSIFLFNATGPIFQGGGGWGHTP